MSIFALLLCFLTCFDFIYDPNLPDSNDINVNQDNFATYGDYYETIKNICESKNLREVRLDKTIAEPLKAYYDSLPRERFVDMSKLSPLLVFSKEGGKNYVTLYLESLIRYENGINVKCFTMINGVPTFIAGDYSNYVSTEIFFPKHVSFKDYTRDGGFLFDPQWVKFQIENNSLLKISRGGALSLTPTLGEYEVDSRDIEAILQKVLPMCTEGKKIGLYVYEKEGKEKVQILIAERMKNDKLGYVNYHGATVLIDGQNISKYFRPLLKDGKQQTKDFPEIMDSRKGIYDPIAIYFTINEDHSISQERVF